MRLCAEVFMEDMQKIATAWALEQEAEEGLEHNQLPETEYREEEATDTQGPGLSRQRGIEVGIPEERGRRDVGWL